MSILSDFLPSSQATNVVGKAISITANTSPISLTDYVAAANTTVPLAGNSSLYDVIGSAQASIFNPISSGTSSAIRTITYGNGLYLMGGVGGVLRSSTDLQTWSAVTSGTTATIVSLAYGNGTYVFGAEAGVFGTSTNGTTWTTATNTRIQTNNFRSVIYDSGKFYYVGDSGAFSTSTNGSTLFTFPIPGTLTQVAAPVTALSAPLQLFYANGLYIATQSADAPITSTDFVTWAASGLANNGFKCAAYGQGVYVVAGGASAAVPVISTSTNGITWTARTSAIASTSHTINSIVYGNGVFVAVTQRGTFQSSTNAITWTARTADFGGSNETDLNFLYDVRYTNGKYVITGSYGLYASSTNAITWEYYPKILSSGTVSVLNAIAYGQGLYVVAGGPTSAPAISSSTDGITWTTRTGVTSSGIYGLAYGNGVFVYGGVNGVIASSTNGITWTSRHAQSFVDAMDVDTVTYGNGIFILGGQENNSVAGTEGISYKTTTNGTTWNVTKYTNLATTSAIQDLIYANGLYMTVNNTRRVFTSTDAYTWTTRTGATNVNFRSVTYGQGLYVVVGSGTSVAGGIQTSTNGITWTDRTANISSGVILNKIVYAEGRFFASGVGGAFATSTNGITWDGNRLVTSPLASASEQDRRLAYTGGIFILGGTAGGIQTSTDGITWTARTSGTSSGITSIAYSTSTIVYVGLGGAIGSSTNGITWTARTTAVTTDIHSVVYGGGKYWSIGGTLSGSQSGTIGTSTDGVTWDFYPRYITTGITTTSAINKIVVGKTETGTLNRMVIAGAAGFIRTSDDGGVTWTARTSGTTTAITGLTYGSSTYLACGINGNLRSSTNAITWTARTPATANADMVDVAYGNGIYIYGGDAGILASSTNAITWVSRISGTASNILSVSYGNGVYLYGGVNGALGTSTDGTTWTARTSGATRTINSVFYANGLYLYGGNNGDLGTSTNAITWTVRTSGFGSQDVEGFVYNAGLYIAHATSGKLRGSTDGVTWNAFTTRDPVNFNILSSTFYNGYYSFVGTNAGYYYTNDPYAFFNIAGVPNYITYGNGVYVAAGDGGLVASSTNGLQWTDRSFASSSNISLLNYANGYFAVGQLSSTRQLFTSTNGVTWIQNTTTINNAGANRDFYGFNYIESNYIVGMDGGFISTSTDFVTWKTRDLPGLNGANMRNFLYGQQTFLALSSNDIAHYKNSFYGVDSAPTASAGVMDVNDIVYNNADGYWSGYFVSYGDYLSFTNTNNQISFGTDNFCIEFWANFNNPTANAFEQVLLNYTGEVIFTTDHFYLGKHQNNSGAMTFWAFNHSGAAPLLADPNLPSAGWMHYAIVRNGNTFTMYRNGTSVHSVTTGTTVNISASNNNECRIGNGLSGYISNLRVVKGSSVYTSNFTPSTTPLTAIANTSLLTTQSNSFVDKSVNNFTITAIGNSEVRGRNPFGLGPFYYVGTTGLYGTSTDSVTWNPQPYINPSFPADNWSTITFQNSLFLAGNDGGGSRGLVTSTNGVTWTVRNSGVANINAIIYQDGRWIIGNNDANSIRTTTDLSTYRTEAIPNSVVNVKRILKQDGKYVIASDVADIYTIADSFFGVSDNQTSGATSSNALSSTYGNGLYLLGGNGGFLVSSTNAYFWEGRTSGTASNIINLFYSNGLYLMGGPNAMLRTSTDGTTWTARSYGDTQDIDSFNYFSQYGYVLTARNSDIYTSTNGTTWSKRPNGNNTDVTNDAYNFSIQVSDGGYVYGGAAGILLYTKDFNLRGTNSDIRDVVYGNGVYVAVGDSGYLATSTNEINWNILNLSQTPFATSTIAAIRYYANNYVFGGSTNKISTTTDFNTWSEKIIGVSTRTLASIDYGNSEYLIAGGASGVTAHVQRVRDTFFGTEFSGNQFDIEKLDNKFYIVGDGGVISTSTDGSTWNKPNYGGRYSILFGNTSFVGLEYNPQMSFSTNNFTIECWVYFVTPISATDKQRLIWFNYLDNFSTDSIYFGPHPDYDGKNTFWAYNLNPSAPLLLDPTVLPANQWIHIAVVRSGNNFNMYRDGVSVANSTYSGSVATGQTFGYFGAGAENSIKGYLSNFRAVNGTAVYTGNFTPPTEPLTAIANTSMLFAASDRIADISPYNMQFVVTSGSPTVDSSNPFDAYGTETSSTIRSITYGNGRFVYAGNDTVGTSTNGSEWVPSSITKLGHAGSDTVYRLAYGNGVYIGAANGKVLTSTDSVTWNSRKSTLLGINSTTDLRDIIYTNSKFYFVGNGGFLATTTDGSTLEYSPFYKTSTNIFVPEVAAFNTTSYNTTLYTRKAENWKSEFNGNFSVLFNPAEQDMIGTPDTGITALDLDGDFTIEAWFYPTVHSGFRFLLNRGGGLNIAWASYELWFRDKGIYFAGSSANAGYDIGGENIDGNTYTGYIGDYVTDNWNHVAVTRSGNVYRGFLNGVQGYTQTLALTPYTATGRGLNIGASFSNTWGVVGNIEAGFTGYISNVRILKGTALYVAGFTPPTGPLTAIANTSLLTAQSYDFVDNSTNNFTIAPYNSPIVTDLNPFIGSKFARETIYIKKN